MTGTYTDFLHDLAVKESAGGTWNGNQITYNVLGHNGTNYLGAYQFDEWAMNNLGYYRDDGDMNNPINWKPGYFTGKNGINSMQDFLNNPAVQNDAARHWFNDLVWQWVKQAGLDSYIGQTVAGIEISATGLLAGAHLLGVDSVKEFLQSGENANTDPFGTPASLYLKMFSDYTSPFDPGGPGVDPYVVNGTLQPRNYSGSGIDTDGDTGNQGTVPGHTGPIDHTPMPYLHGTVPDSTSPTTNPVTPPGTGTSPHTPSDVPTPAQSPAPDPAPTPTPTPVSDPGSYPTPIPLSVPAPGPVLAIDGPEAQIIRLYEGAFHRAPDPAGFHFWTASLAHESLGQIAASFIASDEFQALHLTTDASFLTASYGNTLHRAADSAGLAFWSGDLKAGDSRTQVLVGLTESPEALAQFDPHGWGNLIG